MNQPEILTSIVDSAVKAFAQRKYLESAEAEKEQQCNGEINCLVSKHLNSKALRARAYKLASTFNSIADYDAALGRLTQKQISAGVAIGQGVKKIAKAEVPGDLEEGVQETLSPFGDLLVADELRRIAAAYACLLVEWHKLPSYYADLDGNKPDIKPDSIIGENLTDLFSIIEESGKLDSWKKAAQAKAEPGQKAGLESIAKAFVLAPT